MFCRTKMAVFRFGEEILKLRECKKKKKKKLRFKPKKPSEFQLYIWEVKGSFSY